MKADIAAKTADAVIWREEAPVMAAARSVARRRDWAGAALRAFDVAASLLLLALAAPVMALTALAIKFDSPGPLFYRQRRVGLNRRRWERGSAEERRRRGGFGHEFEVIKFRTMRTDAEADGRAVWCGGDGDPRVTRVGRLLRRAHLDELPQLFNVLRGDMRLVGPRPERPEFVARLAEVVPGYARRLSIKPGVTGLAQIRQKPDLAVDDVRRKVRYDLLYARNVSLWTDLKISFWTVPLMLGLTAEHLRRLRPNSAIRPLAVAAAMLFVRGRS